MVAYFPGITTLNLALMTVKCIKKIDIFPFLTDYDLEFKHGIFRKILIVSFRYIYK